MKKIITMLILVAFVPMLIMSVRADTQVIFTAVENTLERNITDDNMPVWIGDNLYLEYSVLGKLSNAKIYYNVRLQQLLVYNFDSRLTFDLANDQTYDLNGRFYSVKAVRRNGSIFVPIQFICKHFGFYYSYITDGITDPMVRISAEEGSISDSQFTSKMGYLMSSIYDTYLASKEPVAPPKDPNVEPPVTPEPPPTPIKLVYLMFEGINNDVTGDMLDILKLSGYQCGMFATAQQIVECADIIRRAGAEGYCIGLLIDPLADIEEQLTAGNEAMRSVLRTGTRLVCVQGGADLLTQEQRDIIINKGFRMWDGNVSPDSGTSSSATALANTKNMLSRRSATSVLRILPTAGTQGALGSMLSYIRSGRYYVIAISEWDAPINNARDIR